MPARPGYPVSLYVQDLEKNLEYFTRVLGFREVERFELPDGSLAHALVTFGRGRAASGVALASIPKLLAGIDYDFGDFARDLQGTLGAGVVLNFVVPDVDRTHARLRKAGALIDEPPTDQPWGERTISVRTPDGYYLTFAKPIAGFRFPEEFGRLVRPRAARPAKRRARAARRQRPA